MNPGDVYNIPEALTGPDAWRAVLQLDAAGSLAIDFDAIGKCASKPVEAAALELARKVLVHCKDRNTTRNHGAGSGDAAAAAAEEVGGRGSDGRTRSRFEADAIEYRTGQIAVLDSVLARLQSLTKALKTP